MAPRPPPPFPATSCPRTHNINTMSPTVSLAPLILLVATASGKVHEELSGLNHQPLTSAKEAPFKACIDDSDCTVKGTGFACFQYICYPWADDTAIPKKDRYSKSGQNDPINSNLLSNCKHSICHFSCSPGKRLASRTTIARTI